MTIKVLEQRLFEILDEMQDDTPHRHRLQPEFHRIINEMRALGHAVSDRLEALDARLLDEAVEAQFDNMPV